MKKQELIPLQTCFNFDGGDVEQDRDSLFLSYGDDPDTSQFVQKDSVENIYSFSSQSCEIPVESEPSDESELNYHEGQSNLNGETIYTLYTSPIPPNLDKSISNSSSMNKSLSEFSNGLDSKCFPQSPFQNSDKLNSYLNSVVFYNHFKKLSKDFKIIIFNQVVDYLQEFYPNYINDKFKPLTRREKRSVPLLDQRLLDIGGFIYELFESNKKTEVLIPIKKQICKHISAKNKKKNRQFSDEELSFIGKWEANQIRAT